MRVVQSTWVRYHHFELARELQRIGLLSHIFTSLPWWKASRECLLQNIPREKVSCNFFFQGVRRMTWKVPLLKDALDNKLAEWETMAYSRWVASKLPDCEAYIGISGSGLHAGRVAKRRGAMYIMDRGSTHIRFADQVLNDEYSRWGVDRLPISPWLIANEEAEIDESSLITVPSHFALDSFLAMGVEPAKLRVVPYGVNLDEFSPAGRPPQDRLRLLFVGNFCIRKGAIYLLKAFRDFSHPAKELVVIGSISHDIRELVAQYSIPEVRYLGPISRSELKKYMSSSHALVLPSIEEGLALVQGQAMACGCPVIATPNTGAITLFQDGVEGIIVKPMHTGSLVSAFTRLADDPDYRDLLSANALRKARSLGGWSNYASQIVSLIQP